MTDNNGAIGETEALRVYHNPVCSKSRGALEILADRGVDVDVVEYLQERPTRADLERILAAIPDEPAALVRKDKRFKELQLDPGDYQSSEQVVALLLEHPELMERPVVFRGDRALICRPSERVLELLD
jgi:arsenate reductase